MKTERIILISIMFVIVGLGVWLLRENATALILISTAFLGSIGSYLGLDLIGMVKETKLLPGDDYQPMEKYKYYFSLALFIALIAETIFIEFYYHIKISVPMGMFVSGSIIVLGIMLNGFKANSNVTKEKKRIK